METSTLRAWRMWRFSYVPWLSVVAILVLKRNGFVEAKTNSDQVGALQQLYSSTDGSSWNWKYPTETYGRIWNFTTVVGSSTATVDPCGDGWQGLTCSSASSACAALNTSNSGCTIVGISLSEYGLAGSLPADGFLQLLTTLVTLDLGNNAMTSTIPSSLQYLSSLQSLVLSSNAQLGGSLPSSWFDGWADIKEVLVDGCAFFGPLPCFQPSNNPQLIAALMDYNAFSGSICDDYYNLPNLAELVVAYNQLTGILSSKISLMNSLLVFNIQHNLIVGEIPTGLCYLQNLQYLALQENYMTATMPEMMGNMTSLVYLSLYLNSISGAIPTSLGSASSIRSFTVDDNFLTSTLPAVLGDMSLLQLLSVYDNFISSTLPSSLGRLSNLETLIVRGNQFTGSPAAVFTNGSISLTTADFSFNGFTGPLQSFLSKSFPALRTVSVGSNCFTGSIAPELCDSQSLEVISVSGVTSGNGCTRRFWYFLPSSPLYSRSLGGSLPSCVWSLPNLTVLEAAGNGMKGNLPVFDTYQGNLSSLDVSYNRMTGVIPTWIQTWPFSLLKLTSNKFHGEINDMGAYPFSYQPSTTAGSITLEISVNRLSGTIPLPIEHAENVVIVDGNLFSCGQVLREFIFSLQTQRDFSVSLQLDPPASYSRPGQRQLRVRIQSAKY
jgi:LRR receptor-like serine/threonine-protein kinase FLS2